MEQNWDFLFALYDLQIAYFSSCSLQSTCIHALLAAAHVFCLPIVVSPSSSNHPRNHEVVKPVGIQQNPIDGGLKINSEAEAAWRKECSTASLCVLCKMHFWQHCWVGCRSGALRNKISFFSSFGKCEEIVIQVRSNRSRTPSDGTIFAYRLALRVGRLFLDESPALAKKKRLSGGKKLRATESALNSQEKPEQQKPRERNRKNLP